MKGRLLSVMFAMPLLAAGVASAADPAWEKIAPFFQAPEEFKGDLTTYKSPLKFNDGKPVKNSDDWLKRREESLRHWYNAMGPWPGLLEKSRLEFLGSTRRDNFTQNKVRVEIAPSQFGEGYLLVPDGPGPFPAVLVPFYEPETSIGLKGELRDFGYQLAKRGFVTLNIGSPGGDARKPDIGGAQCQPLSFLAYVSANCHTVLANLKEVDPNRIGIVGHSYGGKWAMFSSCLYEKFAAAAWSDGGIVWDEKRSNVNYWDPWYLGFEPGKPRPAGLPDEAHPRTGAYKQLVAGGHDLHELHALMAPRPFLVSGGSEDFPARWRALNHSVAVNKLLGYTNRVAMTNRPNHQPTLESNEQIYAFFEHFLLRPAGSK